MAQACLERDIGLEGDIGLSPLSLLRYEPA